MSVDRVVCRKRNSIGLHLPGLAHIIYKDIRVGTPPQAQPQRSLSGRWSFHIVGGAGVSSDAAKAHYRKTNEDFVYFLHFLTHSISCACVCFDHTGSISHWSDMSVDGRVGF